jgi:hypothetical protein
MSQPEYQGFSKKHPKTMRSWKGAYNFEKTKEYKLAEKWFEERRERQEKKIEPTLTDPPSKAKKGPPPGLTKPLPAKLCRKCNSVMTIPLNNGCCNNTFCLLCTTFESELYNRCYSCKSVIDITKYDEYDSLNLTIPSYNDFIYSEEIKSLQYDDSDNNNQIRDLTLTNYQHYVEYIMLLAKSSQYISQYNLLFST